MITTLSGGLFSGEHTGGFLLPLLRALAPGAAPETLRALHAAIRKGAHVAEYLVLGALLVRALREEGLRGATLAGAALVLGVAWAGLDELRQTFVATRTGSPRDVGVDAAGVLAGVALAVRRRSPRN